MPILHHRITRLKTCKRDKYPIAQLRVTNYRITTLEQQSIQCRNNLAHWKKIQERISTRSFMMHYTLSDLSSIQTEILKDDYMTTHYQRLQHQYLTQPLSFSALYAFIHDWITEMLENESTRDCLYIHFINLRRKILKVKRTHRMKQCLCQHAPTLAA